VIKNQKSLAIQDKAKRLIPSMTQLLSKRPDQFSLGVWPGYYSKAKGAEVWDLDDNHYIDMSISGIGANVLGYADPDVDAAVKTAIDNGVSCSLNCPEEVELAELLISLHPWADMVRYCRSGGESMALAVRIARAASGKDKVAFCGYHGWHDWYLAANLGTKDALGDHLLPGLEPLGVPKALTGTSFPFHYNRLDELESLVKKHRNELGVIVMESIRSQDPDPTFINGVRQIADEIGAVLIVDEISAGFRINTGGAHLKINLHPDIAVFSKAMGNGYPVGAVIGKEKFMQVAQRTFISSTNWTERTGTAAALATICKHRDKDVPKHLIGIGKLMQQGWQDKADKNGLKIHVSGIPPLSHFGFGEGNPYELKALFVQLMLERGFLAANIFYSMLAHTAEHVGKYMIAADEAFGIMREALDQGKVSSMLKGKAAASGFKRLT
jgi:glutamate-1-semialdehyde 2,1-aminomutase